MSRKKPVQVQFQSLAMQLDTKKKNPVQPGTFFVFVSVATQNKTASPTSV